jgi:hypothetical protein
MVGPHGRWAEHNILSSDCAEFSILRSGMLYHHFHCDVLLINIIHNNCNKTLFHSIKMIDIRFKEWT